MAGIRVRLQFPDNEKYWIYIDYGDMRTVEDVVNSINEKFSVCCEKLVLDDAQLPWKESVFLIQERDVLCVHLAPTKKKRKLDDNVTPESDLRKFEDSSDLSHLPKRKKKSSEDKSDKIATSDVTISETRESAQKVKKKKSLKEQFEMDEHNISSSAQDVIQEAPPLQSTSSNGGYEVDKGNTNDNSIITCLQPVKQIDQNLPLENGIIKQQTNETLDNSLSEGTEEEKAKKRRRHRKRKSHHKEEASLNVQAPPVPVDYVPHRPADRKHIRFDDAQEMEVGSPDPVAKVTGSTEAQSKQSVRALQLFPNEEFNPFYKDTSNTMESSPLKPNQLATSKTNVPKPTSAPRVSNQPSNGNLGSSPFGALLSLRSAVFTRNTKDPIKPTEPSYNNVPPPDHLAIAVSSSRAKDQQVDEPVAKTETTDSPQVVDVTKFPLFPGPPRINDVIAFKILELSDNYNPEVSEYIRGRITAIDANSEITIELLEPRAKRNAFGKFELYENDEEGVEELEEVEMETSMSCLWSQLIEPRLIFP